MTHFKQEKASLPKGTPVGTDDGSVEVRDFKPQTFAGAVAHGANLVKEGQDTRFNLHPAARRSLGIEKEENRHLEGKIAEEVERRLQELGEQARAEGFAKGKEEGEQVAREEFSAKIQPVFEAFVQVLADFESSKEEIFRANEQFLIQLVFQVARQVTLKEVKADPEYVKNLCGLLVEKVGAKDHVKIKVGRTDFEQVEAIRDFLKQKFVDLKNIQIDASDEFVNGGCKVETDLARVNASVDKQLELINKSLGGQ